MRNGLSAVFEGGSWAVGEVIMRRHRSLAELPSREARVAGIVVKYALEAGILVLIDTAPEVIAIRVALGAVKELRALRRRQHAQR